ncbi:MULTISPECIES: phasin family protein [Methylobacterium]|uniref:phasin family protein n=1 Tax=Methylobacterium TaxID=407 RepID=UPI001114A63D|nr:MULTISPECIES: phasin family protein [Methylobacterium]
MVARENHTLGGRFVVYEGDRERLGANYIDRSDDLLPTEDRFSNEERQTAPEPWLRQGPEHSLKVRRRAERMAREQSASKRSIDAIDRTAPLTADLAERFVATIDLARRLYVEISDATRSIEAEAKTSDYLLVYVREINSSNTILSEKNMSATFDFSKKLIKARDLQEALSIQNEFAIVQTENVISHARQILELNRKLLNQNDPRNSGQTDRIKAFQAIVEEAENKMKPA